jgi:hypothetical protein
MKAITRANRHLSRHPGSENFRLFVQDKEQYFILIGVPLYIKEKRIYGGQSSWHKGASN